MQLCWFFTLLTAVNALLVQELAFMKDQDMIVHIDQSNFDLIMGPPTDYYSLIMFTSTADDCQQCRDFDYIYRMTSRSIFKSVPDTESKLVVFSIDIAHNRPLFQRLKMNSVPRVWLIPPQSEEWEMKTVPHYPYDVIVASVEDTLHFANFVGNALHINITVDDDLNKERFMKTFILALSVFLFMKKVVMPKLSNKVYTVSMLLSLGLLLISICGYQFCSSNGIPLLVHNEHGSIMLFSGGQNWQFGTEILIISVMYIILGGLVVALIWLPKKYIIFAPVIVGAMYLAFSLLLSFYKVKMPWYPYGMLELYK